MIKTFLTQSLAIIVIALQSLKCLPTQAESISHSNSFPNDKIIYFLAQQRKNATAEVRSFFETGRLRSQDRILFQRPPSDVIPVQSQANAWQFVIFREGNSSFWMPPGILSQETVNLNTSLGVLSFRTLASNAEDRRYVVAYAESLTQEQLQNREVLFRAIVQKLAPNSEFTLKDDRAIAIKEFPGREITFESGEEIIVMRVYLVEQQVYALGVRYPKNNPLPRQTRAFFKCF